MNKMPCTELGLTEPFVMFIASRLTGLQQGTRAGQAVPRLVTYLPGGLVGGS